jgi:hypothetical protein
LDAQAGERSPIPETLRWRKWAAEPNGITGAAEFCRSCSIAGAKAMMRLFVWQLQSGLRLELASFMFTQCL